MRLAIAILLAFTVIAGGLALAVAVLVLAFNLAWGQDEDGTPAREPSTSGDGPSCRPRPEAEGQR